VRLRKSRLEGQNHLPQPAGHASLDAAQVVVGLLSYERPLLGHVELLVNQYSQVLLGRAALNPFSAQPIFVLGIALTQGQGLVEPHEVCTGPLLEPVKVTLDDTSSLQLVDWIA